MDNIAVEFTKVFKKFRLGERFDSLRDFVPAMVQKVFKKNKSKNNNDFWALKGVSFKIKKGEVLGIIGPNGAGKSTILKIISGILKPNKGKVRKIGRLCALIEIGAGFHYDLTGRENIFLNGAILGMKKREIDKKFDDIVDFSGLEKFIDTPIKRYSSGMMARLGFSVAAFMDPDVLLVDEVLSVGDAPFRAKCLKRMEDLMMSNVTVIFVSHNMELIRQLCQKSLVLSDGEVRYLGKTEEAIQHYICIIQKGRSRENVKENLSKEIGRLVGVKIIDKDHNLTNQIECFDPISLILEYELHKSVKDLAFGVSFSLPYGAWVANCNTIRDKVSFGPQRPGRGKVILKIDSVNLSPGDYDITVRFMEPEVGKTIDHHHCQYKLIVGGDPHPGHWVQLKHDWKM